MSKLDAQNERELLVSWVVNGDMDARNELIKAHMPFAAGAAKIYATSGVPMEDLIQSAVMGMIEALDKVNLDRTNRLLTYAVHYIRRRLLLSIAESSRIFRLPPAVATAYYQYRRCAERLTQDRLGQQPDPKEVAAITGLTESMCKSLQILETETMSLDEKWDASEIHGRTIGDTIPADKNPDPYDDTADKVSELLSALSDREQEIINLYYGLDGGPQRTYTELAARHYSTKNGKTIGQISRQRIHQIKNAAEDKLCRMLTEKGLNAS